MSRRDRPKPWEPIIRGPLRLERRWAYQPPPPPVLTVEDEIVRWNERQRLKARG